MNFRHEATTVVIHQSLVTSQWIIKFGQSQSQTTLKLIWYILNLYTALIGISDVVGNLVMP